MNSVKTSQKHSSSVSLYGKGNGGVLRILHVITSLLTGGAERLVVDLTLRLREMGHEVDVAVFNGEDGPFLKELQNHSEVTVYVLGSSFYDIRYIGKLRKIMRGYDIIHTHNSSPQLYAAIANIGLHKRLVTTEHNTSNRKRDRFFLRMVDKWMYRRYEQIICISDKAAENLKFYLKRDDRIRIIYNGVDVERIHQAQPIPEMKSGRFVALMVAAYRKQKDHETVIRAAKRLPKDRFEFWFAGTGDRMDEIKRMVKDEGLEDQVKILGNRTDVPQLLKTADVILMSTHYEGLSLSNIEGMSGGKPFVASDVDGVHEITAGYGVLFPHEDDQTLANILTRLSSDHDYYASVADKCYQRAKEYDLGKMVAKYEEVYKIVLQ